MRSLALRPLFFGALMLGLAGCPGDDSGDDSNDSANDTTTDSTSAGTAEDTATVDPTTTGDDTTTAADTTTTGELILENIDVTVNYEGALEGTLTVAALIEFPPQGPPLAFVQDMEPTFPWSGTLMNLEPGEYIMFATIDVGNDSPTMPGPEDPVVIGEVPVVVDDSGGPFSIELTLTDPM